jgi:hypothetical protein
MLTQAEIRLAEIDDHIAETDQNIRQIGSMIPGLADRGFSTSEVEFFVELMTQALHCLRAQRQSIVTTLDGDEPPPRIVREQHAWQHA